MQSSTGSTDYKNLSIIKFQHFEMLFHSDILGKAIPTHVATKEHCLAKKYNKAALSEFSVMEKSFRMPLGLTISGEYIGNASHTQYNKCPYKMLSTL